MSNLDEQQRADVVPSGGPTSSGGAPNWAELAGRLNIDGRAVIDGERADAAAGRTFTSVNPATNQPLADVVSGNADDVDRAVRAARRAFQDGDWSRSAAEDRKAVLCRLADLLDEHGDELALLDSLEMGKPVAEARAVDVQGTAATFRWYAEAIDKLIDEIPSTPPGSVAMVTREPVGVVGAIVPWNYPLEIAGWKLAPALALGNSVLLKPAAQSSLSVLRLADLALQAGLPRGVLNVLPGPGGSVGEAIGLHPDIDALSFTGSTAVAKRLLGYAGASNLKRLSLEAGGKSANLVFADAEDLAAAATKAAFGAFYNQGEVCSANSRLLVERSIYHDFVELLIEAAGDYLPGDPLSAASGTGSLVSAEHAEDVWAAVQKGRVDGDLLHGGDRLEINGSQAFITPTIVGGLQASHQLLQEEVFGPLLTVVPFDAEDEAVGIANSTPYGLAASVWTSNLSRAHRVAGQLVAGTVSVNTVDALGVTTPFGGFKQSGFGRDLSLHALDNYSAMKTTWIQFG
ncbi:aldehyde dehydrogenase family protein [Saxibacter everestensis]|uniref:Aldehyde dehydrogenase family protein n=1 Tax=Saxibacter everestensis TaxID=2909229 RepID=A0ABY8QPY3_9MICO|nr:aldehyde dehydrogenase family protein [Brevibacteriaceae bacterium ZFBP1038]